MSHLNKRYLEGEETSMAQMDDVTPPPHKRLREGEFDEKETLARLLNDSPANKLSLEEALKRFKIIIHDEASRLIREEGMDPPSAINLLMHKLQSQAESERYQPKPEEIRLVIELGKEFDFSEVDAIRVLIVRQELIKLRTQYGGSLDPIQAIEVLVQRVKGSVGIKRKITSDENIMNEYKSIGESNQDQNNDDTNKRRKMTIDSNNNDIDGINMNNNININIESSSIPFIINNNNHLFTPLDDFNKKQDNHFHSYPPPPQIPTPPIHFSSSSTSTLTSPIIMTHNNNSNSSNNMISNDNLNNPTKRSRSKQQQQQQQQQYQSDGMMVDDIVNQTVTPQ